MSAFFLTAKPCLKLWNLRKSEKCKSRIHKNTIFYSRIPIFYRTVTIQYSLYYSTIQQYRLASSSDDPNHIKNPLNFAFWAFQNSTPIYKISYYFKITHTFSHEVREQVPIPCWFWPSNLNKDFISSSVQSSIAFCRKSLKTNKSLSNYSPSILCITSLPNDWSPSS